MANDIVKENQHEVAPDSVRKGRLLIRYDKSFTARLIQAEDDLRNYYNELKAELLSYEGVKGRISWKHEAFRKGKEIVALIKIRGKHISVYLPLNANDYIDSKYKVDDVSNVKANADTPCAYAIKNDRRCLYAKDLIAAVMSKLDGQKQEIKPVKYTKDYPYDTTENLVKRELIKLIYIRIGEKGKEEPLKEVTEEEIEALMAEEPVEEIAEEVVEEEVVEEEPVEEPVEEVVEEPVEEKPAPVEEKPAEPVKPVEKKEKPVKKQPKAAPVVKAGERHMDKTKMGIINVDTLSRHFEAGETVTLDEIKSRVPCFDQKVTYIKVLARGVIDKALTVEADAFSQDALEKITLAGGTILLTLR